MAEEKKEKKSSGGGNNGMGPIADVLFWVLLALAALSVIAGMFSAVNINLSFPSGVEIVAFIFNRVQIFSVFISLVFFTGIIYCNHKLGEVLHGGHHGHDDGSHGASSVKNVKAHAPDKRWLHIVEKMSSANDADWKMAILEADIILEDMLSRMGYQGEGIAEKLKKVEKSDFHTIESAWDAHKIRNEIAHGGSSYKLSRSQAEKAIALFKEVFEEFYFI